MSFANQLMNQTIRKMAAANASRIEVAIMAGCERCGKRLVEDGKPAAGATLVAPTMLDALITRSRRRIANNA